MNPPQKPPPLRQPASSGPPPIQPSATTVNVGTPSSSAADVGPESYATTPSSLLTWGAQHKLLAGGVIAAVYFSGLAAGLVYFRSPSEVPSSVVVNNNNTVEIPSVPTRFFTPPDSPLPDKEQVESKPSADVPPVETTLVVETPPPLAISTGTVSTPPLPASPVPKPTPVTATAAVTGAPVPPLPTSPARDPFVDLQRRNFMLDLPLRSTGALGQVAAAELARIDVDRAGDCSIRLIGSEAAFGANRSVTLDAVQASTNDAAWTLNYAGKSFAGVSAKKPVAALTLDGATGKLHFAWEAILPAGIKDTVDALRLCAIEFTVGNRSQRCIFTRPVKAAPLKLSFTPKAASLPNAVTMPSSEVQVLEIGTRGQADVSLMLDAQSPRFTAGTPGIDVRFEFAPTANVASPLPPPRKGVSIQVGGDPEIACRLELELCDGEIKGLPVALIRATVLYSPIDLNPQRATAAKPIVEPLSPDKLRETMARFAKFAQSGETAQTGMERELVGDPKLRLADLERRLSSMSSTSSSSSYAMSRSQLQSEILQLQNFIENGERRLKSDSRYLLIVKNREAATNLLKRYENVSAPLLKFQDETRIDYRITFNQAGNSLILCDTQAAPVGP